VNGSSRSRPTRREVLERLSSFGLAAVAVGAGALAFHDRHRAPTEAAALPDWRVDSYTPPFRVAAARGDDPATNVRRAVAALGGIERFVVAGDRVLIKPNVGWDRLPEQAANTDPRVVAELVRLCRGAGARRIVVTDISCNDPRRCFVRSGIAAAAREAGADVAFAGVRTVPVMLAGFCSGLDVVEELFVATKVINVPVVKHHGLARATLGMKNWFGVLGRGRNRLHQSIDRAVAELGATFRPTLTVVDATRVLVANGPQGGSLADVRAVNSVAVGTDPVLSDAWGAARLGLDPRTLGFIAEAARRGLGSADLADVKDLGAA
jgi:uncharacterized protein (DUF362 family)